MSYMRLIVLAAAMLLTSCATTKIVQTPPLPSAEKIAPDLDDIQQVKLLPHQQLPVDYLISHPDVKGLLVNHYMGTGKTYLGIGFAEQMPGYDVVILAPGFIETHWMQHIKQFPAKNLNRYQFVSYANAPKVLLGRDMSKTVVIMDEVHNLIRSIKSADPSVNRTYSALYEHLRSSYKILALSGTPIYNDEYDLAYLMNLISGKDIMPFNEERFRLEYTEIRPIRSFWRGYIFESNILQIGLPILSMYLLTFPLIPVLGPVAAAVGGGGALLSALGIPVIKNWIMPLNKFPLRQLNVEKFEPFISKYVSFYEIADLDMSDFPDKTIHQEEVSYNAEQFWFFLNFAEKSLNNEGLAKIYRDVDSMKDSSYLTLNSTLLQERLLSINGSGREIGNLDFEGEEGGIIESPKFIEVLRQIESSGNPKTVVYSSYYENGIHAFSRFLERRGYKYKYAILKPDLPATEFARIVSQYNNGDIKLLLLHPDITEGISLKGTRQFHILEPVLNQTIFDQVVARAVRYQSHANLPESERHVDVYVWKAIIGSGYAMLKLKKANWFKRYGELSDWSDWGGGQRQIDKNYDRKKISPDAETALRLESVNENMMALKEIMKKHSIERQVVETNGVKHAY